MQDVTRPIFAPVILGTSRQGRASEHAAHFVVDHVAKRPDMRTDLIDIRDIRLSIDDAGRLFDTSTGQITDVAYAGRLDKFLNELVWMARALRYARENIPAV